MGSPTGSNLGSAESLEDAAGNFLEGFVVDSEFVGIAGANVSLTPGERFTESADDGSFRIGPLEPGAYAVRAERQGYRIGETSVDVGEGLPNRVVLALESVSTNVPYFQTLVFNGFMTCGTGTDYFYAPCDIVKRYTGTGFSNDKTEFRFQILDANLANLLVETTWKDQLTGRDMAYIMTSQAPLDYTWASQRFFAGHIGGSPLRVVFTPGVVGSGGNIPFDGNQSAAFVAFYRPAHTNSTLNVIAVYVEHRYDSYFTFFYNRPMTPGFSILTDT